MLKEQRVYVLKKSLKLRRLKINSKKGARVVRVDSGNAFLQNCYVIMEKTEKAEN